jgi:hypothetical protein
MREFEVKGATDVTGFPCSATPGRWPGPARSRY